MDQTKATIITIVIMVAAVGGLLWWGSVQENAPASGEYLAFAQCLKDKNVTMYGAEWCPHCKDQKKMFGDAFKLVPYVECPENTQLCTEKGITGYPTWILPDGKKLSGTQPLQTLAQETGCALPTPAPK